MSDACKTAQYWLTELFKQRARHIEAWSTNRVGPIEPIGTPKRGRPELRQGRLEHDPHTLPGKFAQGRYSIGDRTKAACIGIRAKHSRACCIIAVVDPLVGKAR